MNTVNLLSLPAGRQGGVVENKFRLIIKCQQSNHSIM